MAGDLTYLQSLGQGNDTTGAWTGTYGGNADVMKDPGARWGSMMSSAGYDWKDPSQFAAAGAGLGLTPEQQAQVMSSFGGQQTANQQAAANQHWYTDLGKVGPMVGAGILGAGAAGAMGWLGEGAGNVADLYGSGSAGATGTWGGGELADLYGTGTAGATGSAIENLGASSLGAAGGGGGGNTWLSSLSKSLSSIIPGFGSGAGAAGGSSWLGPLMSIGSGAYGMYLSNQQRKLAQAADPWGTSGGRAGASGQLTNLLNDPSSIYKMPGWEAGMEAVRRTVGTPGGTMNAGLRQYGSDFYNNAVNQLSGLAGTGNAGLGLSGNMSAAQLASQSLASIGYGGTQATGGGVVIPPQVRQWLQSQGVNLNA